ncbi:MAG TPA: superoxide dismutase, partial [Actinomycetota bacterium]|nr:superoxide dismutase [Actinomycetota bacterium]
MLRIPAARRLLVLLLMALVALVPATAGAATFPDLIRLPDGWQPEGIAAGRGSSLYVGSIPTGAIWKADARTGQGEVLVEGREGRAAIGIKVDRRNRLFVAGGPTGMAFVYDARTGEDLASYQLTPEGTAATFVNDVAVTGKAAYFTDSLNQQLYVVPFGRGGRLPGQDKVRVLPPTGDLDYIEGFNLNGIAADRGGQALLAVQSNTGLLFRINPRTGVTRQVDLGGASLTNGDGLLLLGRVLFVVQNRLNQIAVVKLSRSLDRGRLVTTITDPDFDVPTTIAFQDGRLYAVNARFGTSGPQPARYDI